MNSNFVDRKGLRRRIVEEDGTATLIEDSPGLSVEINGSEPSDVDVSDAEWQRAKGRLSTHALTFNPETGRFNSKERKLDKGQAVKDNQEEVSG